MAASVSVPPPILTNVPLLEALSAKTLEKMWLVPVGIFKLADPLRLNPSFAGTVELLKLNSNAPPLLIVIMFEMVAPPSEAFEGMLPPPNQSSVPPSMITRLVRLNTLLATPEAPSCNVPAPVLPKAPPLN